MEEASHPKPSERGGRSPRRLREARVAVVQALYQIDLTGAPVDSVLAEFLRYRLARGAGEGPAVDTARFSEILRGTMRRRAEIDAMLVAVLPPSWPLVRLEVVLRAVLRAGAYELLARPVVPVRVVVSEYVDLARGFLSEPETGMVNGILDRLARSLRPGELEGPGRDQAAPTG
ncbi:MAG: transcription antitermination factor NusB [Alphaproteobacteria bacterium]|nr:transcription antitermination factor NusB [Alphaproteobacteria bacterium]